MPRLRPQLTLRAAMILVGVVAVFCAVAAVVSRPRPPTAVVFGGTIRLLPSADLEAEGGQAWFVRNTGRGPLRVWFVAAGKGCGSETFRDGRVITVAPGRHALVAMRWSARREPGSLLRQLHLGTNDPAAPVITLTVLADVFPTGPPGPSPSK